MDRLWRGFWWVEVCCMCRHLLNRNTHYRCLGKSRKIGSEWCSWLEEWKVYWKGTWSDITCTAETNVDVIIANVCLRRWWGDGESGESVAGCLESHLEVSRESTTVCYGHSQGAWVGSSVNLDLVWKWRESLCSSKEVIRNERPSKNRRGCRWPTENTGGHVHGTYSRPSEDQRLRCRRHVHNDWLTDAIRVVRVAEVLQD